MADSGWPTTLKLPYRVSGTNPSKVGPKISSARQVGAPKSTETELRRRTGYGALLLDEGLICGREHELRTLYRGRDVRQGQCFAEIRENESGEALKIVER